MLDVFGFSNTQLGDLFAIYGVTAMASYFPGGAIADKFSARFLLTTSLVATGCGGLYMATIPGAAGMAILYAFWGVTTIFLFWGALIRATREWGGESEQGAAFGTLESGRGVAAALFASLLVAVFAWYMPDDATLASDATRRAGFQLVVLGYSSISIAAGLSVWLIIPNPGDVSPMRRSPFGNMLLVLRRPVIWAQAAIIVCAYCGYKGADYYALYAVEVLGKDEVEGAMLASYGAYVRPVAALTAGLIADRIGASRAIGGVFLIMAVVYAVLSVITPDTTLVGVIYLNFGISLVAIFALRGIYFALLQETRTPSHITGAAVGMISLVGYTPEIFFAPIAGRILDASPGVGGFLNLFTLLASISAAGVLCVAWLMFLQRNKNVME